MSEYYPDDGDLLALTAEPHSGVEYIETGKAPYYLEFRRTLYRLLANLAPIGLRVHKTADLAVQVKDGYYWFGGQLKFFPGSAADLPLANNDTNYVYLTADNEAAAATDAAGWPADEHIKLASIQTEAGTFGCDDIVDLRGHALMHSLACLTATPAEISQALAGVSANVTGANLGELTGGGQTQLHSHAGILEGLTATVEEINQAIGGISQNVTAANLSTLTDGQEGGSLHYHLGLSEPSAQGLSLSTGSRLTHDVSAGSNSEAIHATVNGTFDHQTRHDADGIHDSADGGVRFTTRQLAPVHLHAVGEGEITSSQAGRLLGIVPIGGVVADVILSVGANGADANDDLSIAATANVNGVALCTTDPAIDKTAASDGFATTAVAGTGITQAAVKTDGTEIVAKGDIISVDLTLTRTTPEDEIADVCVLVKIRPTAGD